MKTLVEGATRKAAEGARISARDFSGFYANEDLSKQVLQHFQTFTLGKIQPDARIDQAVEKVQAKAQAVTRAVNPADQRAADRARDELVDAIDALERTILRVGIGNASADALGYALAGERIADA